MKRIQFLFLFSLLFLGACDKFSTKKHYTLDPSFRTFFNYQNGSEWKYFEVSDTSKVETVTVSGYLSGRMTWDAFDQEFIQYDLVSDKDSTLKLRAVADENNVARASLLVKDTLFKQCAEWYYVSGQFAGSALDSFVMHPTYVQNGKSYNEVIELIPKSSILFKRLFIAKSIGIIRKELKSGKTFVLKSYQVQ
ncbi:MAG: hypothetical protein IT244_06680 [Bacteroidia bacterium]|nr:hypothetical protein [Bacteroidia bacterium]